MKTKALMISQGGKVLTSEARAIASAYLAAIKRIVDLEKQVETLGGGIGVTMYSWKDEGKHGKDFDPNHSRVWSFVRADGTHSVSTSSISRVNEILRFGIDVDCRMDLHYTKLIGPVEQLKRFIETNRIITELMQYAYNEGFSDGRAVLRGLAGGSVSISDLIAFETNVSNLDARLPRD